MLSLLVTLALIIGTHFAAVVSVANSAARSKTLVQFINDMQAKVYAVIGVVAGVIVFIPNSSPFNMVATIYLITLCFVDYENTFENIEKVD
jgi:fructose-specific phosphotransferase system IIC component